MVMVEAGYTSRLDIIKDVPEGKIIYWFEDTDMKKAKEVLAGKVCIQGNVPMSVLVAGSPEDVRACCKNLIDTVGKGRRIHYVSCYGFNGRRETGKPAGHDRVYEGIWGLLVTAQLLEESMQNRPFTARFAQDAEYAKISFFPARFVRLLESGRIACPALEYIPNAGQRKINAFLCVLGVLNDRREWAVNKDSAFSS